VPGDSPECLENPASGGIRLKQKASLTEIQDDHSLARAASRRFSFLSNHSFSAPPSEAVVRAPYCRNESSFCPVPYQFCYARTLHTRATRVNPDSLIVRIGGENARCLNAGTSCRQREGKEAGAFGEEARAVRSRFSGVVGREAKGMSPLPEDYVGLRLSVAGRGAINPSTSWATKCSVRGKPRSTVTRLRWR